MEIVTALPWELGADLVITAGILKAGILVGGLLLAVRALPARLTELRASLWVFGFAALLAVPLVSANAGRPLLELQVVSFPQGLFRAEGASSPAFWVFLVWASGAAALLGRFLLHFLRVHRVAGAARPVESSRLLGLLEEARERVGVDRPVRLAVSPDAGAPLLVGWLRPVVLLAPEATEWPEDRLLAVLCHELAHVGRGDYAAMVLGELVRALYWVNPLVFFGIREARMEQDKACDAVALRAGFRSAVYARHLVDVARCLRARAVAPAALGFGRRSDLRSRVGVLLDRGEDAGRARRGRRAGRHELLDLHRRSLRPAHPTDPARSVSSPAVCREMLVAVSEIFFSLRAPGTARRPGPRLRPLPASEALFVTMYEKIISRAPGILLLLLTAFSLPAPRATPAGAQEIPVTPGYEVEASGATDGTAALRVFDARSAPSAVDVDGVLEREEWSGAQAIPLRWEVDPGDNEAAPVETTCRIAHDGKNLYLGCEATDPDPGSVRAYVTDRDGIEGHDRVVVTLDPFRDARRGYVFGISALGVQYDALFDQQGRNFQGGGDPRHDPSWDAIWSSAGRITEEGWSVEAAIPFRSLRFPEGSGERSWGILVSRFWPRSTEVELRSAPLDRDDACVLCQADRLAGLDGISPGRNLQLSPTFTASRRDEAEEGSSGLATGSVSADPGLDLRWSPTPELALDATVNPDFSQVEADAAQLDVNRSFALFFPEKRPFFQEGADVFRTPVRALFTRTVVDPIGGGKVTGKAGPYALGALVVRDEVNSLLLPGPQGSSSLLLEEPVTTAVGRARRDLGTSSTVGGLVVAREGPGYHNRVAGADLFVQPWPSVTGTFQYLRSWTRYPDEVGDAISEESGPAAPARSPAESGFRGDAFYGQLRFQSREWILNSDLRYRGDRFRADAGFQPQVGVRGGNASVERVLRGGRDRWFSRLSFQVGTWGNEEIDGPLLDGGLWLGVRYGGPLQTSVTWFPNFFRQSFAGEEYGMTIHYFDARVRPWGSVGLRVEGQVGDAVDFANARAADQVTLSPTLDLRVGRRTSLELSHRFQRLATADGGREILEAHVSEARAVYNFSNRAFVRAILQHRLTDRNPGVHADPVSTRARSLFSQLLFSYKVNPQTLVFLGWTDDRAGASELPTRELSLEPRGRTLFLKVGYAWRP